MAHELWFTGIPEKHSPCCIMFDLLATYYGPKRKICNLWWNKREKKAEKQNEKELDSFKSDPYSLGKGMDGWDLKGVQQGTIYLDKEAGSGNPIKKFSNSCIRSITQWSYLLFSRCSCSIYYY